MGPIAAFGVHEAPQSKPEVPAATNEARKLLEYTEPRSLDLAGVFYFIFEGGGFKAYRIAYKTTFFFIKLCCKNIKITFWGQQPNCKSMAEVFLCSVKRYEMHILKKKCVAYVLLRFHCAAVCWLLGSINKLRALPLSHFVSG